MHIYRVIFDVAKDDPANFSNETIRSGTILYGYDGNTYGCVDENRGLALTLNSDGSAPFFEFPREAVDEINASSF